MSQESYPRATYTLGTQWKKNNWYTSPSQTRDGVPQAYNLPHAEMQKFRDSDGLEQRSCALIQSVSTLIIN